MQAPNPVTRWLNLALVNLISSAAPFWGMRNRMFVPHHQKIFSSERTSLASPAWQNISMAQEGSPFRDHWVVRLLDQLSEVYEAKENINQHALLLFSPHMHTGRLTISTCPAWEGSMATWCWDPWHSWRAASSLEALKCRETVQRGHLEIFKDGSLARLCNSQGMRIRE